MIHYWQDMSADEIKALFNESDGNWIGILPLGATEQHGDHLPFETDTLIARGIVERLVDALSKNAKIVILPVEEIGYSPEHLDYAGSKSLSYDEAILRWIGIGEKLNSHGIRKLILLNAHGGNSPLMSIVATELRVRHAMLAVATSWTRFGTPAGLIREDELAFGIHGGEIETSAMLALHPELVSLEKSKKFTNLQEKLSQENEYLRAYGKHAFGWKMQDLNSRGVVGDAAGASAETGEKLLDHSVAGLMQLVEEVDRFDIGYFDECDLLDGENKQDE